MIWQQAAIELAVNPGVCPKAPPGVAPYTTQVLQWVKWSVLTIMGILTFSSVGMLVWGRVTHHPKGARLGFDGLLIIGVGSILYVVLPPIFSSITGAC